jgi:uncharacterized membrane protein
MIGTPVSDMALSESRGLIIGRVCARWPLALLFLAAGIIHIWKPEPFLLITPDWVPYPQQVILGTGICEIIGAFALLTKRLRYAAGIGFALYAVCVYPANIKHAFYGLPGDHAQLTWWYHGPRLAFQPVIVWWSLFAGEVITWPFGKKSDARTTHPSSLPKPDDHLGEEVATNEKSLHREETR